MALEQSIAKAFSSSKQSFERMDGLVGEVLGTPAVANQLGKALADAGVGKHAQNTQEFLSKAAHIVDEVLPAMQENSANIDEDDLADLFEKELGKPIKDALADALANTTSPVGATAGTPSFPQPARSGILPDEPAAPAAGPSAPQQPTPTDESPVEQDAEAAPETPEQEQPDQQASPTAAEPEAAAGGSESAADQAPENNAAPGESSAPSPSAPAPATTPGPSSPSAAPSGGSGAPAGQASPMGDSPDARPSWADDSAPAQADKAPQAEDQDAPPTTPEEAGEPGPADAPTPAPGDEQGHPPTEASAPGQTASEEGVDDTASATDENKPDPLGFDQDPLAGQEEQLEPEEEKEEAPAQQNQEQAPQNAIQQRLAAARARARARQKGKKKEDQKGKGPGASTKGRGSSNMVMAIFWMLHDVIAFPMAILAIFFPEFTVPIMIVITTGLLIFMAFIDPDMFWYIVAFIAAPKEPEGDLAKEEAKYGVGEKAKEDFIQAQKSKALKAAVKNVGFRGLMAYFGFVASLPVFLALYWWFHIRFVEAGQPTTKDSLWAFASAFYKQPSSSS